MALLRAESKGKEIIRQVPRSDGSLDTRASGVYDGIIETAEDLALPRIGDFAPGSMLYCLSNQSIYIKNSHGLWQGVSE